MVDIFNIVFVLAIWLIIFVVLNLIIVLVSRLLFRNINLKPIQIMLLVVMVVLLILDLTGSIHLFSSLQYGLYSIK